MNQRTVIHTARGGRISVANGDGGAVFLHVVDADDATVNLRLDPRETALLLVGLWNARGAALDRIGELLKPTWEGLLAEVRSYYMRLPVVHDAKEKP